MATVSKWTPFGVALDITATATSVKRTSATKFTVTFDTSWETYYNGAKTVYGMTASSGGGSANLKSFNGNAASSGSGSFTGEYSISGNGSATKSVTVTFRNYNEDTGDAATKGVKLSVTVPAWTSYKITYNANGGSGAPSSQTKWKDQALTLSTTKPTRTGYTFQGWATSSSGSVAYAAGAKYEENAAATLYAIWKAITYTVKYNANGGSNAPGNQTKTYGKTLVLSSTTPVRTNYNFKGWGTSSSATTVAYASGANYTKNAAVTLYAVWELAYIKPRISDLEVVRCDSSGKATDDGTNGVISFDWECDKAVSSIVIKWKLSSGTTWTSSTVSASGTSGTVSHVIGSNNLSVESTYDIHITVTDESGSSYAIGSLTSMIFTVDFLAGGKGVAFGKTAELENTVEFDFDAKFNKNVHGSVLGLNRLPEITVNDDLNNYLHPGCWGVYTVTNARTIANIPVQVSGRFEVSAATGVGYRDNGSMNLRQRYIPYTTNNGIWERDVIRDADGVWSYREWYRSTLNITASKKVYHEQKVLWSGVKQMVDTDSINLSEAITEQPNGIVLVFSKVTEEGEARENNYNSFFIPRIFVDTHDGSGSSFTMMDINFGQISNKYLYINDTYIAGHASNIISGTGSSGIIYANNKYALRYVYGV